jgi:putative oxidoreductase
MGHPKRTIDGGDVARLVLRGALGSTMLAHGIRHGRTLEGTAGWFGSIGFQQPRLQAQLSSVVEIGSGAALIAGFATPLSASAVVGTMSVAYQSVHKPNGYFIVDEGWEYVGFISLAAVALSALGSGRASLDHLLGLDRAGTGLGRALLTAGAGVAGAAAQLKMFYRRPAATG